MNTHDLKNYVSDYGKHKLLNNEGFLKLREMNIEKWQQYFITGDYDMHDLVSFTGQRHTIPSDSFDERKKIGQMNKSMLKSREISRGKSYDRIQHGAQVNYIAHTLDKEKGEKIVSSVAEMGPPVAICSKGEWSILKDQKSIRMWYNENFVKLKLTWSESAEGRAQLKSMIERRKARINMLHIINRRHGNDDLLDNQIRRQPRNLYNLSHEEQNEQTKKIDIIFQEEIIKRLKKQYLTIKEFKKVLSGISQLRFTYLKILKNPHIDTFQQLKTVLSPNEIYQIYLWIKPPKRSQTQERATTNSKKVNRVKYQFHQPF